MKMGVPENGSMIVQVDFEVFGHVQGEIFSLFAFIHRFVSLLNRTKKTYI